MNHLALVTHLLPLTKVDSACLKWTLEGSGKLWRAQINSGGPRLASGGPKVASGGPRVASGGPKVAF